MPLLLFDLSEVILRGLKGTELALSHELDLPPHHIHRQFNEPELEDFFLGRISETAYWETLLARHRWNTTTDRLMEHVRENMTEVHGMFPLLEELNTRGHQLALLSNHGQEWVDHLEQQYPRLRELFPVRLYSHQLHLTKPNPQVFRRALEELNAHAGQTLFIDDMHKNLTAAAGLGIRTLPFYTAHQLRQALTAQGYL